jgi:hypothetical protein
MDRDKGLIWIGYHTFDRGPQGGRYGVDRPGRSCVDKHKAGPQVGRPQAQELRSEERRHGRGSDRSSVIRRLSPDRLIVCVGSQERAKAAGVVQTPESKRHV